MVSRTEELGQAVMPVMFLVIISFFIASFGMQNPNSTLVTVMSFIPFFSPLIMFLRIGLSDPALWEILISIGIMFASIGILAWLSAKIYRAGVLMYGKRPSFKELRKAMKSFNA
nr:ABC transporter permease [Paenibacillus larvae]